MLLVFAEGARSAPPETQLRVFSDPRRPADRIALPLPNLLSVVPVSDANLRKSRLLAKGYGVRLYGVPADNGALCQIYVPEIGGSCGSGLYHGGFPSLDWTEFNRVLVSGVLSNEVTRVDVRLRSGLRRARLGRNAYLYELPAGLTHPQAVVLHDRDGTRHVFKYVPRKTLLPTVP
jgi:hypothetical protein